MRKNLGWVPPALLAVLLVVLWCLFLSGGMRAVRGWALLLSAGQIVAPLYLIGIVIQLIRKRRFSPQLTATAAVTAVALWPGLWGFGILPIAFPYEIASQQPHATVRLPSNERLRVAWGGDRLAANYHASVPNQRWAYDLLVEPAIHGSETLTDYGCFGTPVVAPVSARVHHATDGNPDHVPGKISKDFENPVGNMVALELETGTYLLIAHLKQGSVLVKEGDRVEEGQPIGKCGNSGNTSEPHIHIHHQRQDPSHKRNWLLAEGLPLFFRDHDGPAMPDGGLKKTDGKFELTGATVQHAARQAPPATQ